MYFLGSSCSADTYQTVELLIRVPWQARWGDLCDFHFAKLANFAISTLQIMEYF